MLLGSLALVYGDLEKVLKCCVCERLVTVRKLRVRLKERIWVDAYRDVLRENINFCEGVSHQDRRASKFSAVEKNEMVGALRKLAYSRPSQRSKHQYLMVEGVGGKRISPAAALHGVPLLENFEAVEHPAEPTEMDDPVRCPPPEKSIIQDGLFWRERVARHFHRPIDRVSTWQEGDAARLAGGDVSNPGRPNHSNLSDNCLFVTHSAPETAVSHMLL